MWVIGVWLFSQLCTLRLTRSAVDGGYSYFDVVFWEWRLQTDALGFGSSDRWVFGQNLSALSRLCGSQARIQYRRVSLFLYLAAGCFSITTGGVSAPLAAAGKSLNHVFKPDEVCVQSLECLMKTIHRSAVCLLLV